MLHNSIKFVFLGTDEFAVIVLEELKNARFIPALVVTAPDRPKGRGLMLTPPPVKIWAQENNVQFLQPQKLDKSLVSTFNAQRYALFVVASYGKIIPKEILDIPKHGTLNVHPSLLPLFRGPSPIHSQILENSRTVGVTIMLMDEKVDHGPILAQQALELQISDFKFQKLRDALARAGGKLLVETIPEWIAGNINPQGQDHVAATYTKQIKKEDGLIDLNGSSELNYRKFLAYSNWPSIYFFQNGERIKITDAELQNVSFIIKKVIQEGKKEMDYKNFIKQFDQENHAS